LEKKLRLETSVFDEAIQQRVGNIQP